MSDNPSRRYSEQLRGADFDFAYTRFVVCSDCGAIVASEKWHDEFHDQLNAAARLAQEAESVASWFGKPLG